MRGTWDGFSRAAVVLCLGCESLSVHEVAVTEGTTGELSSTASTLTGSADTAAGSGGAGASSVSTSSGSVSSDGASTSTDTGTGTGTAASTSAGAIDSTTTAGGTGGQVTSSGDETHACLEYVLGFCEFTARCSGGLDGVIPCFEGNRDSCPDVLFGPGSARTVESTFACADAWRALACDITRPE